MFDLTLPGYKYLGPGNKLDKGPPTDYNDWIAYVHDLGYGEIIDKGGNPYIHFNDADEQAIQQFDWSSYGGALGKSFFQIKKKLAEYGVIGHIDNMGKFKHLSNLRSKSTVKKPKKAEVEIDSFGNTIADNKKQKTDLGSLRGTRDTQGGTVHKAPPTVIPPDPEDIPTMEAGDVDMGVETSMALSAGGGGQNTGAEETPVMYNSREELGVFTETRTAILPVTFYFSMNVLNATTPTEVRIRLNVPYNILAGNTFVTQTESATRTAGLSFDAAPNSNSNLSTLVPFPTALTGSIGSTTTTSGAGTVNDADLYPAWIKWYEKAYESYHNMMTEYKITIRAGGSNSSTEAVVYEQMDAYTSSSTGNVIPTGATKYYWDTWKRIKHHKIAPKQLANGEDYTKVIQGVWKPGMIHHNTVNSTDIKTWYPTGAEPGSPNPAWVEQIVLAAFLAENAPISSTTLSQLNVKVQLRYHVQFKDLKVNVRYPISTNTDINFIVPDDILQKPNTPGAWL